MSRFTDLLHEAEVDDPVEEAAVLGARVTKVHQGGACTQSGNHDVTQQGKIRKYDEEEWEGRTKSTMEKSAREELKVR